VLGSSRERCYKVQVCVGEMGQAFETMVDAGTLKLVLG
jgi:hypothetical protein